AAHHHGQEIAADNRRELQNAVAEHVAGEAARYELVDETASGDQHHRDEEQNRHGSVHGGRDDDGDGDRHRADQDGHRDVLLLHHFLPEVVRRQPVEDDERQREDEDPQRREHHGIHDVLHGQHLHLTFLPR